MTALRSRPFTFRGFRDSSRPKTQTGFWLAAGGFSPTAGTESSLGSVVRLMADGRPYSAAITAVGSCRYVPHTVTGSARVTDGPATYFILNLLIIQRINITYIRHFIKVYRIQPSAYCFMGGGDCLPIK